MDNLLIPHQTLADLLPGQSAIVTELRCAGPARWEMTRLRLLPGMRVSAQMSSPCGALMAFRNCGAVFVLCKSKAKLVRVQIE